MAKTLGQIRMEFTEAKAQAKRIDELATQINNMADNQLAGIISKVNKSWNSDSGHAYVRKATVLQQNMRARAKELKRIASSIRTIATNTYNAEMRNYQIAQQRKYK